MREISWTDRPHTVNPLHKGVKGVPREQNGSCRFGKVRIVVSDPSGAYWFVARVYVNDKQIGKAISAPRSDTVWKRARLVLRNWLEELEPGTTDQYGEDY